jgi:hypothetical protein
MTRRRSLQALSFRAVALEAAAIVEDAGLTDALLPGR